jgi:hypothetical protein
MPKPISNQPPPVPTPHQEEASADGLRMYSNALERVDGTQKQIDWTDPLLRKLWGQVNAENARDYVREAREVSRGR